MKKTQFLLLIILQSFFLNAQENNLKRLPLNVSYYGYNVFHPGLKIGTQILLKNWDKTKRDFVKQKKLFLSPQIGMYVHRKSHSGLLLNTELGIESSKANKRFYNAHSFGLGYLVQINEGTTYSLQDDSGIEEKKVSTKSYLMTSYNYEFGQHLTPKFTWFSKFSLASKLFYNTGVSIHIFMELGLKFRLK